MNLDETGIMEYFRIEMRTKFTSPNQLMNVAYAVNVSMPQLEQMELDFLKNENPQPTTPFDENGNPPKEKIKTSQLLVENHELREKCRQAESELAEVQSAFDAYRRKAENDRVSLHRRLAIVSESLEAAITEKKEMKAKMGRSEKDMDNMQLNIAELMRSNVMLSEELRALGAQTNPVAHMTALRSSLGNPGSATNSPREESPPQEARNKRALSIW